MQFGLIGEKLGHSYSKEIHERLGSYAYELHPLPPAALPAFMEAKAFRGINVTIPYKQAVIPYCDEVDQRALRIGAVNTIVNRDGRLYGYNTDYYGLTYMLRRHGVQLGGRVVLVLGSGGTAATLQAVAEDEGAKEILVASRTAKPGAVSYEQAMQRADVQVVVNCSPAGMYPNNGTKLVDLAAFPQLEAVLDAVYNPFKTALVLQAGALGVKAVGGFEMLVAQAVGAAGHFVGSHIAESRTGEITNEMLARMCNLSLVGMPGCGKTSLGKALAKQLDKKFVDLDALIVQREGRSIPAVFAAEGEAYFRRVEAEVCREAGAVGGQVIATGGGIVKNEANINALRQNGPVVFIDCPVERLAISDGRPLAKGREDLHRLYGERLPMYQAAADVIMEYHPYFKENTERLEKAFQQAVAEVWAAPQG